jgi:hypothetical protein
MINHTINYNIPLECDDTDLVQSLSKASFGIYDEGVSATTWKQRVHSAQNLRSIVSSYTHSAIEAAPLTSLPSRDFTMAAFVQRKQWAESCGILFPDST